MRSRLIFELVPEEDFDFQDFIVNVSNGRPVDLSRCELKQIHSVVDSFRPEFISFIAQHGLSALMRRGLLEENFVALGTSFADVHALLQEFLKNLSVETDLIIVDPYFFAPNTDSSYLSLIQKIIHPLLSTLRNLTVVTLPNKVDAQLCKDVTAALKVSSPSLSVTHKTSYSFHDRVWINPILSTGFICGTSLNGLGKKYAFVDRLEPSDAAEVLTALRKEKLL